MLPLSSACHPLRTPKRPLRAAATAALLVRAVLLLPSASLAAGAQAPHPSLASALLPGLSSSSAHFYAANASSPSSAAASASPAAAMSAPRRSAPLVFPAPKTHTATVIFAHGLGDTGHGWASAVENWRRRQRLDEVKFVLPHAPQIAITVNYGMKMPGWFDIKQFDGPPEQLRRLEDEAGMLQTRDYFQSLIQAEIDAGISSERIVLGGFSQGGAMALLSGLTAPTKLGGIVGLSAWLPLSQKLKDMLPEGNPNAETKIFMGHGDSDTLVKTQNGKESSELLRGQGFDVVFKLYEDMGHSACVEELDDVEAFLRERLPPLNG